MQAKKRAPEARARGYGDDRLWFRGPAGAADMPSNQVRVRVSARRDTQSRIREYELRDLVRGHHQTRDRQRVKKAGLHLNRQEDVDGIVGSAAGRRRGGVRDGDQQADETDSDEARRKPD